MQHDILHRLYRLDKKYLNSFRILLQMKSNQVFEYFDKGYPKFDSDLIIKHLILLLSIDSKKTLKHLLGIKPQETVQASQIKKCIHNIDIERNQKLEIASRQPSNQSSTKQREKILEGIEEKYDQIIYKFLHEVFEFHMDCIDEINFKKLFKFYIKFDQDKVMNLLRAMNSKGLDLKFAETDCEDRGLHVEQAYIIL